MAEARRWISLLLAAAVLLCSGVPGRAAETEEMMQETMVPVETTLPEETMLETTIPEETVQETTIPEEITQETTLPEETVPETTLPEETISGTAAPEEPESMPPEETEGLMWDLLSGNAEERMLAQIEKSLQATPLSPTAENSVATLESGSGIKFRIFNYTNGRDSGGNYITAGGINDNGLSGYFDFRGTSFENTAADGNLVSNFTNEITDIDGYTANHATVLPNLGADGYPVFDGSRDNGPQRSLGYLFGAGGKGVTAYAPANTLLRQNSRGQYYYNSADNAVDFDTQGNRFIVRTYRERGKTTANQGSGQYYDFFPFTYWDGTTKYDASTANWYNFEVPEVDYWYGMTMEAAFPMPAGGQVQGEDMVFAFSGDDDVWVFIDDVLVLDLGGTHGVVSGSINFATGEVKQYLDWGGANEASTGTTWPTTLKNQFQRAGNEPNGGWNGNVFANYTQHTIKFYYLERAASCANCKILFNMPILPTGKLTAEKEVVGTATELTASAEYGFSLVQVTENGEKAASGVRFDRIDSKTGAVLGTGTTGAEGVFSLEAGQRAEFDLPAGKTYLIREVSPGQYAESLRCRVNGVDQLLPEETGGIVIDPEAVADVLFTNRLKTTSFTVTKQVSGNLGDRSQSFSFKVRLYTAEPGTSAFMPFPQPETGEAYTVREGEARFRLAHGGRITLDDIPLGAWAVVTEEMAEGYETEYQVEDVTTQGRTVRLPALTDPAEAAYFNRRDVLIQTGVELEWAPYLWMAAGGLPLVIRRRKRE